MLVKNAGIIQTLSYPPSGAPPHLHASAWDAHYDGTHANIAIANNEDGQTSQFNVRLTNDDLAQMLNMDANSVNLDERLAQDFTPFAQHLPSPKSGDNYVVPITIDRPRNRGKSRSKSRKSHITHRAYKRRRASRRKSRTNSNTSKHSNRNKSNTKSKKSNSPFFQSSLPTGFI